MSWQIYSVIPWWSVDFPYSHVFICNIWISPKFVSKIISTESENGSVFKYRPNLARRSLEVGLVEHSSHHEPPAFHFISISCCLATSVSMTRKSTYEIFSEQISLILNVLLKSVSPSNDIPSSVLTCAVLKKSPDIRTYALMSLCIAPSDQAVAF
jgi:hypothetical protein